MNRFNSRRSSIWGGNTLDAMMQYTNPASKPAELKITDLRVATVAPAPMTCPVIRIDTNQGIYGLGEVRDGASKLYALMLKSRIQHCAAATDNFLVLENHSVDVPWWSDLVDGVEKPIVNKGFVTVPDKPGFGITLNDEVMKQHLLEPGYFEPSPQWDKETGRVNDRLFS
jgi:L-alanine-DL-glutamate epimerase-like enolase superfamily enzyme